MTRFMKRLLFAFSLISWMVAPVGAQDPLVVLPESYTLQFENDWVRVVRVHYEPRAKLPTHAHNDLAAAYVYLKDGGPVVFGHIGASYGAATRPPTKGGSFRLYRAVKEVHEVENQSDLPSDFLRVEFKTDPLEAALLNGRYHREPATAGETAAKIQFENAQLRVTRVVVVPGKPYDVATSDREPSLLVFLTEKPFGLGNTRFVRPGDTLRIEAAADAPTEVLRFELKTTPHTTNQGR